MLDFARVFAGSWQCVIDRTGAANILVYAPDTRSAEGCFFDELR